MWKKRSKIKNRIDKIFDTSYLINNEGNLNFYKLKLIPLFDSKVFNKYD